MILFIACLVLCADGRCLGFYADFREQEMIVACGNEFVCILNVHYEKNACSRYYYIV